MNLIIFGASGRVGRLVVKRALIEGHSVTAFVHTTNPFADEARLKVVTGDVRSYDDVVIAMSGHQAVISTLGSWKTKEKDIVSAGISIILQAMEHVQIQRLITLTGSGAYWSGDTLRPIDMVSHIMLKCIAPKILRDGELHIKKIESSNTDWTIIRAPALKDGAPTDYKLSPIIGSPLASCTKATVAQVLVDQLTDTGHVRQAPVVHAQ